MGEIDQRCAEGYRFLNEADAKLAAKERKQVEYLQQRLRSDKPDEIKAFYEKAINENVFKTPVGLEYLNQLQYYMINQGIALRDELMFIPINHPCEKMIKPRTDVKKEKESENLGRKYKISFLLNIMLVVAVIIMFVVALTGKNENVLNYKRAITDQYSAWEQELTQREETVREKEKELKEWNN